MVQDDPWKLLIATMLLNKTSGKVALPVFWYLVQRWPTPKELAVGERLQLSQSLVCLIIFLVEFETLEALLHHLGLSNMRARRLIALSEMYIHYPPNPLLLYRSKVTKGKTNVDYPPTHVSHYPGSGKYALDSYRSFCMGKGEWKKVLSDDKELRRYLVSPAVPGGSHSILTCPSVGDGPSKSSRNGMKRLVLWGQQPPTTLNASHKS